MTALVATEFLKLRLTRATWIFLAVALALSAARVTMVLSSAGTAAGVDRGTSEATLTLAGAAGTGTLLALFLGITSVTGEFRHATLTGTLLRVPDRRRIVVAKALTLAAVGGVTALALSILGVVVGLSQGVAGPLEFGASLRLAIAIAVGGAFWGWLGVGVGLVVTNQTIAVLVPVGWLLVVEPLVGSFGLDVLVPWLPGSLPGALAGLAGENAPPAWAAVAALVGYGIALSLLGARLLERRDVT
jgi:ABC-2 type transport system permease protein